MSTAHDFLLQAELTRSAAAAEAKRSRRLVINNELLRSRTSLQPVASSSQLTESPEPLTVRVGNYGNVTLNRMNNPVGLGSTCLRPLSNKSCDYVALAACELLDKQLCRHCSSVQERASGGQPAAALAEASFDLRQAVLLQRLKTFMPAASKEDLLKVLSNVDWSSTSLTGLTEQ